MYITSKNVQLSNINFPSNFIAVHTSPNQVEWSIPRGVVLSLFLLAYLMFFFLFLLGPFNKCTFHFGNNIRVFLTIANPLEIEETKLKLTNNSILLSRNASITNKQIEVRVSCLVHCLIVQHISAIDRNVWVRDLLNQSWKLGRESQIFFKTMYPVTRQIWEIESVQ